MLPNETKTNNQETGVESSDVAKAASFTEFVSSTEATLRQALTAAFGAERGRDAVAEALAYGWQRWDEIDGMDKPCRVPLPGWLTTMPRRCHSAGLPPLPEVPQEVTPWVEPALPDALARLPERQRVAVYLVIGLEWDHEGGGGPARHLEVFGAETRGTRHGRSSDVGWEQSNDGGSRDPDPGLRASRGCDTAALDRG